MTSERPPELSVEERRNLVEGLRLAADDPDRWRLHGTLNDAADEIDALAARLSEKTENYVTVLRDLAEAKKEVSEAEQREGREWERAMKAEKRLAEMSSTPPSADALVERLRSAAEHLSRTAKKSTLSWDDYDRPRGVSWRVSNAAMKGLRAALSTNEVSAPQGVSTSSAGASQLDSEGEDDEED